MFKKLYIEGFKSIKSDSINIQPLTLLAGLNSSGKSSVIQAIRMLFSEQNRSSVYLKGYGGFSELKSKFSEFDSKILLKIEKDAETYLKVELTHENEMIAGSVPDFNYQYVGADRLGPASTLPTMPDGNVSISVGERGEYSADYFKSFEDLIVHPNVCHSATVSQTLKHQVDAWMGEISPGTNLQFGTLERHDVSHVEVDGYRATNAGFGISYSLPIILSALVFSSQRGGAENCQRKFSDWVNLNADNRPVLLVENPEAHIHPRGQTAMGRLLALVASCGVQVIIETHSDHLIDGVRIAVKNNLISSADILVHFFELDESGITKRTEISVDGNGKLSAWPEGFFDQSIINLRELA